MGGVVCCSNCREKTTKLEFEPPTEDDNVDLMIEDEI